MSHMSCRTSIIIMAANIGSSDRFNRGVSNWVIAKYLADATVCGSALWAMHRINHIQHPYALSSYVYLLGHGLMCLRLNLNPICTRYYQKSKKIASILPIGMLNFELLLAYEDSSYQIDRYLLATYGFSTMVSALLELRSYDDSENGTIMTQLESSCSLAFLSSLTDNVSGSLAAVWKFMDVCLLQSNLIVPSDDDAESSQNRVITNISLAVFCILSACAIGFLNNSNEKGKSVDNFIVDIIMKTCSAFWFQWKWFDAIKSIKEVLWKCLYIHTHI